MVVVTRLEDQDRYVQVFVDQAALGTVDKLRPIRARLLDKLA